MMSNAEIIDFITSSSEGKVNVSDVRKLIDSGVFSKNLIKKFYMDVVKHLLDHNKLEDKNLRRFIRILTIVRRFTKNFKKELNYVDSSLYVSTYQAAGKSIRRLGKVEEGYEVKDFVPKSVFHLPETINRAIKLIRELSHGKAFIVIDAVRNSYEAKFFKDRCAAFHLISINAPDEHRTKYLQKLHRFSPEQIKRIEDEESGK